MYKKCGERPVPVVKFEIVAGNSGYFYSESELVVVLWVAVVSTFSADRKRRLP